MDKNKKLSFYLEQRKDIENNPKIRNPRFTFIYTINLDGRINQERIRNSKHKSIKKFFSTLIDDPSFVYEDPTTHLPSFIDNHFLEKGILGIWKINPKGIDYSNYDSFVNRYLKDLLNYDIKTEEEGAKKKSEKGAEIKIAFADFFAAETLFPYIKLFSTGGLGILFDLEIKSIKKGTCATDVYIKASDCIKLTQYPNLTKNLYDKEYFKVLFNNTLKTMRSGLLNAISFFICQIIFNKFIAGIRKEHGKYFFIEKITGPENITDNFVTNRYFADENKRLNIYPYVGIVFSELPSEITLAGLGESGWARRDKGCRLLFALANQTVPFLDNFMEPHEYLKKKNISRGEKDAIIIERRGLVAAGSRSPNWDEFLMNAYATLILCLESILATTKSVSTLNRDIEQYISKDITSLLVSIEEKSFVVDLEERHKKLSEVLVKINKARTLSPCEDISSNILPFVKSRVSYEGTKQFKKYALDDLIDLVHNRLNNYGHFLKAEGEKLAVDYNQSVNNLLIQLLESMAEK